MNLAPGQVNCFTMPPKQRADRPKKRRQFHGNRHTGLLETPGSASELNETTPLQSSSAQKLHRHLQEPEIRSDETLSRYRLFDVHQFVDFLQQFPCPTCQHTGYDATESTTGLATTVLFTCKACSAEWNFKNVCGENINFRFQMAIYSIGGHYTHGQRFLANMNIPPPVSATRSRHYKARIHGATEKVAKQSMAESASELRHSLPPDCDNVTVSCDGTWHKDVALLVRMVWRLFLQSTQMVLPRL